MIRLIHLADVHLDAPYSAFGPLAERRRADVVKAFCDLPTIAEREHADAVLIAGDLFDGPTPREATLAAVRETFRRLHDAGCPVMLVAGNHDALTLRPSPYDAPLGDIRLFREPAFGSPVSVDTPGGPLHLYGISFDAAREPDPLATFRRSEEPGAHVVLLHGSVPDAPHWEGGRSLRLPLERLRELEVDYLALGDHHRFRAPEEFDRSGALPACYSGSFAAVDLTECGPRGYVLVQLAPGAVPSVRLLGSGVREVADLGRVDVSGCSDDLEVAGSVAERVPGDAVPVVTLAGEPDFPVKASRVASQLVARFGCARVIDETRYYASHRVRELMRGSTIAAHVARLGVQRIEGAADEEARSSRERALRLVLSALDVE
ncbi:MAG: exonuclease SbcCD subunit D [Gemmatimonadota bacterium]